MIIVSYAIPLVAVWISNISFDCEPDLMATELIASIPLLSYQSTY